MSIPAPPSDTRSAGFDSYLEGEPEPGGPDLRRALSPEAVVALVLFWATAVVVFLQFFTRYVLNDSLSWTEEIARYLLIALTFLGASAVVRRQEHINLSYFADKLPPRPRRLLAIAAQLVALGFFGAFTWYGVQVARLMGNQPMVSVDYPMGVIYWTVVAGFAGMTFRTALILRAMLRGAPDGATRSLMQK